MRGGCRPPQGWAGSSLHAPPGMLRLVGACYIDSLQWTGDRLQMTPGQMQIHRRIGELGMPEQKLNGAEIGTGLQHVRGETMSKCVRRDALGDAGTLRCRCDSGPGDLIRDRHIRSPVVLHAWAQIGPGLHPAPVLRKVSSSLGLNGTSRSRPPLPCWT